MNSIATISIYESDEWKVVPVRPLNRVEQELIGRFQQFLGLVVQYTSAANNRNSYGWFKTEVAKFSKYGFYQPLGELLAEIDKHLSTYDSAVGKREEVASKIAHTNKRLLGLVSSGSIQSAIALNKTSGLGDLISKYKAANQNIDKLLSFGNPFVIKPNFFFRPKGVLGQLSEEEIKRLITKNTSVHKYTFLNFTNKLMDDFTYLVYFIDKLTDEYKPVRLSGGDFRRYVDYLYINSGEYLTFKDKIDKFLITNDKSLVSDILNGINKYPELRELSAKLNATIKVVYRGVGFFNDGSKLVSSTEAAEHDRKSGLVSTSRSESVAKRFALGRGHLMFNKDNDRDYGYIFTYEVGPSSIIIDTRVFGGVYEEDEVLIDASKARLVGAKAIGRAPAV